MRKDIRKWAIFVVAFLLCFSLVVNVHCVVLLHRYRDIYLASPVWVNEKGEQIVADGVQSSSGDLDIKDQEVSNQADEPQDTEKSVLSDESVKEQDASSVNQSTNTVYLTKSGTKFHRDGCKSLAKSKIPISYEDAKARGFEPCAVCKP